MSLTHLAPEIEARCNQVEPSSYGTGDQSKMKGSGGRRNSLAGKLGDLSVLPYAIQPLENQHHPRSSFSHDQPLRCVGSRPRK
jgi:hypothetical protein